MIRSSAKRNLNKQQVIEIMIFRDNYSPLQGLEFVTRRFFMQPASFLWEGRKHVYSCKQAAARCEWDKVLHHLHCCHQELLSSFVVLLFSSYPNYLPCPPCPVNMGCHMLLQLADRDVRKARFLFPFFFPGTSLWVWLLQMVELPSSRRLVMPAKQRLQATVPSLLQKRKNFPIPKVTFWKKKIICY